MDKEYKLSVDPKILELLGPSLYTNIYFILAELIANAYDADAKNVYIIADENSIIVEDDGKGMSYQNGDITRYLSVAEVSRNNEEESFTRVLKRKKMGRKGVGKLAALSVSEDVLVKTVSLGEKSGFVLSRHVGENNKLRPIPEEEIQFKRILNNGTAIIMNNPQYKLHKTIKAVKKNLLRIFPLVDENFQIHLIFGKKEEIINSSDKEIISQLSTLITLGEEFKDLSIYFENQYSDDHHSFIKNCRYSKNIKMEDKYGKIKECNITIKGWIGTYKSTRGRKSELTDFPDNFISLYANNKMGEFNILPMVGQNKLAEVYVVGQLHVDAFEETELPDMALSNRQGYKSDDPRYKLVLDFVRKELLPELLRMREDYVDQKNKDTENKKIKKQLKNESKLKESVDSFKKATIKGAKERISKELGIENKAQVDQIENILKKEINFNSEFIGIKNKVDSQKKKLLISHTFKDKDLGDVIYQMLIYNNLIPEDIIYSSSDDERSRIPEGDVGKSGIYDYLRNFFVDSYSTEKIYVIFITSKNMAVSWGALVEVGAAWITQIEHKIFNIDDFRPTHPLDDGQQWHMSCRDKTGNLYMSPLSEDIFCQKIEYICRKLGFMPKSREKNKAYLETLVTIKDD